MRVIWGQRYVSMTYHGSHEEMSRFVTDGTFQHIAGESVKAYEGSCSIHIHDDDHEDDARIGLILGTEPVSPLIAVAPDGSFCAIGFNRDLLMVNGWPPAVRHMPLRGLFDTLLVIDGRILAVHELGCVAVSTDAEKIWSVSTDIVEDFKLADGVLTIRDDLGKSYSIDIESGQSSAPTL